MGECKKIGEYELEIRFSTVLKSSDTSIFESDPFQFYNTSEGKSRLNSYVGPRHVLYNSTADCMMALNHNDINEGTVRGVACTTRERLNQTASWSVSECLKINEEYRARTLLQIKKYKNSHHIKCQGSKIVTNRQELECPDNIFSLPETESSSIGDYHYSHLATNLISKVVLESSAPTRINLQLKTRGLRFTTKIEDVLDEATTSWSSEPIKDIVQVARKSSLVEGVLRLGGDVYERGMFYIDIFKMALVIMILLVTYSILSPVVKFVFLTLFLALRQIWSSLGVFQSIRHLWLEKKTLLPTVDRTKASKKTKPSSGKKSSYHLLCIMAVALIIPIAIGEPTRKDVPSIPARVFTLGEAQEELVLLRDLIQTLCKEGDKNMCIGGKHEYVVTLACYIAQRAFNCQCVPKEEHIPILNESNIKKFNAYSPTTELTDDMKKITKLLQAANNRTSLREKLLGN